MTARSFVCVDLHDGRRLIGTVEMQPRRLRRLVKLSRLSWFPYTVAMYDSVAQERLEIHSDVVRHVLVAACERKVT